MRSRETRGERDELVEQRVLSEENKSSVGELISSPEVLYSQE
jgi:hypothetical protein